MKLKNFKFQKKVENFKIFVSNFTKKNLTKKKFCLEFFEKIFEKKKLEKFKFFRLRLVLNARKLYT